jgi:hypothetical protein
MKRAAVNGAEVEYEVTGAGDATLLIHGALLAEAMAPLADTAALEGFELIRYHRRGHAEAHIRRRRRSPSTPTTPRRSSSTSTMAARM